MKVLTVSKWLVLALMLVVIITAVMVFSHVENKTPREQKKIEIILPEGGKR